MKKNTLYMITMIFSAAVTLLPGCAKNNEVQIETVVEFHEPSVADTADTTESTAWIDTELAELEKQAAVLEHKLLNDASTQLEMNELSGQIYELWDVELNRIWKQLTEILDENSMEQLRVEEREWITHKNQEIEKAGAEYSGGSIQPLVVNKKAAELTKSRVYELADYLRR